MTTECGVPPTAAVRFRTRWRPALLLLTALLLSACGGSDASLSATSASTTTSGSAPAAMASPSTRPSTTAVGDTRPAASATATASDASISSQRTASPELALTADPDAAIAEFQAHAGDLVGGVEGLVEVVIQHPGAEPLFTTNAQEPIEAASLYKLPVLVEVFRLRDAGVISFDETVVLEPGYFMEDDSVYGVESIGAAVAIGTLVEEMATLSSNVAAKALLAMAGTEQVNATMAALGLASTEIRWSPSAEARTRRNAERTLARVAGVLPAPGEDATSDDPRADDALNVTTAADMALLFALLVEGKIVSPAASAEMLEILTHQQINDRLPAGVPEGTTVAHKTGNLEGLVHDVGVIWAPAGPVVVVVLTEALDEGAAIDLIRELAAAAYAFGN